MIIHNTNNALFKNKKVNVQTLHMKKQATGKTPLFEFDRRKPATSDRVNRYPFESSSEVQARPACAGCCAQARNEHQHKTAHPAPVITSH